MEGLFSIGAIILGIIIWLAFNSLVTRWYFGSSCLSVLLSIFFEIIICIGIAGGIISLLGKLLGNLLGVVGGVLLFLIKAALIIIAIAAVIGIVYFIYNKIKGNNFDFGNITSKVKEFTRTESEEETPANYVNEETDVDDFGNVTNTVKESTCTNNEEETSADNENDASTVDQDMNEIIQPTIEKGIKEELEPKSNELESNEAESNEPEPQVPNKSNEMFCGGCRKKVSRTIKFCPYCGKENKYTRL